MPRQSLLDTPHADLALPALPRGFLIGSATACYQIEGAAREDGRGPSIWDTFSHTPGRTEGGATGDVACDFYHRYRDDIAMMAAAGLQAFRFSIGWPRIQPHADQVVNERGLDFYERLVDTLLEHDFQPWATLFHWDLPQWVQDRGGWMARDTVFRFAEYAQIVQSRLQDRVVGWMTFNEIRVHWELGHVRTDHAPALGLGAAAFPALHHQMLAHGHAVVALRAGRLGQSMVGAAHDLAAIRVLGIPSEADIEAVEAIDLVYRCTTDPLFVGRYPEGISTMFPSAETCVRAGDTEVMSSPLDFLAVNNYYSDFVRAPEEGDPLPFHFIGGDEIHRRLGVEVSQMGWPTVPDAMHELLVGLRDRYGAALPPIYISENGLSFDDSTVQDGGGERVHDPERIDYIRRHLNAIATAIAEGVDVRGYFYWSFLDNLEWHWGFGPRFGLVRVDYESLQRTPKDSLAYLGEVARSTST